MADASRHGQNWTAGERSYLKSLLEAGDSIESIARTLQRTPLAIDFAVKQIVADWHGVETAECLTMGQAVDFITRNKPNKPNNPIRNSKMKTQTELKQNHTIALLQKNYTTIEVVFNPEDTCNRYYTYKAPLGVKVDQLVVVNPGNSWSDMKVCLVVAVHETPQIELGSNIFYKWIVSIVDESNYERRMDGEIDFLAQLKEIEAQKLKKEVVEDFRKSFEPDSLPLLDKAVAMLEDSAVEVKPEVETHEVKPATKY